MRGNDFIRRSVIHVLWALPVGVASLFVSTPLGNRLLRWLDRDDGTTQYCCPTRREGLLTDQDVYDIGHSVARNSWIVDEAITPKDVAQTTWMRWAAHPEYEALSPGQQVAIVKRTAQRVVYDINRKRSGRRGDEAKNSGAQSPDQSEAQSNSKQSGRRDDGTKNREPQPEQVEPQANGKQSARKRDETKNGGQPRRFESLADDYVLPSMEEDALETVLGEERLALFRAEMEKVSERLGDDTPEGKSWRALRESDGDLTKAALALGRSKKTVSNALSKIRAQKDALLSPEVMAALR